MQRHILTILSVISLTSLSGAGIGVGSWLAMSMPKSDKDNGFNTIN
jgi:hypothetical protein